jgi:hydrogenase maturation protein HypF
MGLPVEKVQHHIAHVYSVLAENQIKGDAFAAAWDGTGFGTDHAIWGGEFFTVREGGIERSGHLRPFPLVGGDKAAKEPRRPALGILYELFGEGAFDLKPSPTLEAFEPRELLVLRKKLMAPDRALTTSMGRFFDAAASLAGVCQRSRFEGEAAMVLEFNTHGLESGEAYPFPLHSRGDGFILDWEPLVKELLADMGREVPAWIISQRFHNALAEGLVAAAKRVGLEQVGLSGGCFQNRYLTERAVHRLKQEGFRPFWQKRVPPNDGGLSLGQAVYARLRLKGLKHDLPQRPDGGSRDNNSKPNNSV